jgi:hypothetical protein
MSSPIVIDLSLNLAVGSNGTLLIIISLALINPEKNIYKFNHLLVNMFVMLLI